ncbi:hypothetical protein D3C78_1511850 [compost metagenome]
MRIAHQHLVVALSGIVALVAVFAVGEDPQATGLIKAQSVRTVESIVGRDIWCAAIHAFRMGNRVTAQRVNIPVE